MAASRPDPYETLGVEAGASDAEIRAAYRRLVQLHHPDHNNGSAESARRFEEVQDAYARIRALRAAPGGASRQPPPAGRPPRSARWAPTGGQAPPRVPVDDPELEARLADIERQLARERAARARAEREAQQARERAARAAREAAAQSEHRPSDEELGYIKTDDSFGKIFSDALSGLSDRVSEARKTPVGEHVGDLIEELDELASKLTGKRPPRSPG